MNRKTALTTVGLIAAAAMTGCMAPKIKDSEHLARFESKAADARAKFEKEYPELTSQFSSAAGYAIFPTMGQGAWGLGLGFGEGLVYSGGSAIGTAGNNDVNIGFQLGGQAYSKVIFFNTPEALSNFTGKGGQNDWSLEANAVFGPWGASADGASEPSTEIYTVQKGGLMYQAAIGWQYFDYRALDDK